MGDADNPIETEEAIEFVVALVPTAMPLDTFATAEDPIAID